jgi:hypothetical protein
VTPFFKRTRLAYLATRILDTPFWALYNLLPVILYKELHATSFQIAIMVALKPLVSLLSLYWSSAINKRQDLLVSEPWFFIVAFAFYMMLAVGVVPAWMEILKLNIPKGTRERVFSYAQAFGYMGGGLLPFILGWALDDYFQAWRWLFPLTASVAMLSTIFQYRILIPPFDAKSVQESSEKATNLEFVYLPWKRAWTLVKNRQDFRHFQIGFMILGCGLMIIQPALPQFFVEVLNLSYTELSVALTLCKGIGFVLASPFWASSIKRLDVYRYSSWIAFGAAFLPICLILVKWDLIWLYLGYILYGFMQAGNELIWNMSGPLFSKEEDSSVYTGVNVVAVGLRGCFIPLLGSLFMTYLGVSFVMLLSVFLCLWAMNCFLIYSRRKSVVGTA